MWQVFLEIVRGILTSTNISAQMISIGKPHNMHCSTFTTRFIPPISSRAHQRIDVLIPEQMILTLRVRAEVVLRSYSLLPAPTKPGCAHIQKELALYGLEMLGNADNPFHFSVSSRVVWAVFGHF
jgi:hypothetical protein